MFLIQCSTSDSGQASADKPLEGLSRVLQFTEEKKEAIQTVEESLVSFSEGFPVLMNALNELAVIHPAVSGNVVLSLLRAVLP